MSSQRPTPLPASQIPNKPGTRMTMSSTVPISAPPALVFKALTDPQTWPDWNTFVPRADVEHIGTREPSSISSLAIGDKMTLHVQMTYASASRESVVYVSALSEPSIPSPESKEDHPVDLPEGSYRIAWGAQSTFLWAARELHVLPDPADPERCTFRTYEHLGGVLAIAVRLLYQHTLDARFEDWASDLRDYAEAAHAKAREQTS